MGVRLQDRDTELIRAIYEIGDGLLARRHIQALFWPDSTEDAMRKRLKKLNETGYIFWPDKKAYHAWGIPESVVYLDWLGILWIARQSGVEVAAPAAINENQRRLLEKALRKEGISWRRAFTRNIAHDLQVIDFRLAVRRALRELPDFGLQTWIPERTLRVWQHRVTYTAKNETGERQQKERGVIPDGVFIIKDQRRDRKARCLLELDMASHSNRSFLDDKVLPYAAYISSPVYCQSYGANSGRWLIVVAAGKKRLKNLLNQMEKIAEEKAALFLFTTTGRVQGANVLTSPIWRQPGKKESVALVDVEPVTIPVRAGDGVQGATGSVRVRPVTLKRAVTVWKRDASSR